MIDPVCLVHGKRQSGHECLYCCLCFKSLTVEECHLLPNGQREDVCNACAALEQNSLTTIPLTHLDVSLMKPLIAIIQSAIAFIATQLGIKTKLKAELDAANATIASQADAIEALKKQVDDDTVDDAALELAAAEARNEATASKARADALQGENDAAQAEGDKLAAALNENPDVPVTGLKF